MDGVGVHGNIFHWNVCQQERLPVLEAAAAPHLLRHRQQGCRHRQGEGREGEEREAFTAEHSEQGNNIPACCISYRHQCTFTPTPLSCSYTLGNVQIKAGHLKRILFPMQLQWQNLQIRPHMVTISMSRPLETWRLSGIHWSIYTKKPPASLKKSQSCRGCAVLAKPSDLKSLPNMPTLTTLLSTSYKFSLCWYNFNKLNLKEFHNNPALFSQLRLERRFGSLPAR